MGFCMYWKRCVEEFLLVNGEDNKNVANGAHKVMGNGVLLTFSQTPIIFLPQLQLLQLRISHFCCTSRHQHLRFSFTVTNYSKWDSNAERVRAQNFEFSFDQNDDEEDDEEEKRFYGNVKKKKRRWWWSKKPSKVKYKRSGNVFDEAIESVLILKVLKSFGWFLPAIIISYLLASGPKAFLMTLAISLALSLVLLAFEKLWGKKQHKPKRKAGMKRKESSVHASSVEMEEGEGEAFQETTKAKRGNQSRVGSNNGPVKRGSQGLPEFGGWDFLDEAGSMQGISRVTNQSQRKQNGKLSGSGRKSDTPLLLRFVDCFFPFIGFWAKMFW